MLQAWIDNELGNAERVILEQHLAECPACSVTLKKHQKSAALLFEVFSEFRLKHDLRKGVLEHLPEMDPLRRSVVDTAQRTNVVRRGWFPKWVPLLAAMLLVALASLIYSQWPQDMIVAKDVVGVVAHSFGQNSSQELGRDSQMTARVAELIQCGERFSTGAGARMLLALLGPTQVKLNENTRVVVRGDRDVHIEEGRVSFDVAKAERKFQVQTPSAKVTVHGTNFEVQVDPERTVVTVRAGRVTVENGFAQAELLPGEQAACAAGRESLNTAKVDADSLMRWADGLTPDKEAVAVLTSTLGMTVPAELRAEQFFVLRTETEERDLAVTTFYLTWEADKDASDCCAYDVFVYNDKMVELFRQRIEKAVFVDRSQSSVEIKVPGNPIEDASVLHIKIVPDFTTGAKETSFTKVSALGI